MITEVYFIEGFYLYTEVGSSGRGVLASSGGVTGTICIVAVRVRRPLQSGAQRALGSSYWRRKPNGRFSICPSRSLYSINRQLHPLILIFLKRSY